jgi:hypothetical protein
MRGEYKGDCIDTLIDICNTTNAKWGIRLERYPIEQIIDVLTAEPPQPLPQCIHCEGILQLVPCHACREWVCMDCSKKYHACNQIDGPSTDQLRG